MSARNALPVMAALGLGSIALAQAGVEGQYDLLFPRKPALEAPVTTVAAPTPVVTPAPVVVAAALPAPQPPLAPPIAAPALPTPAPVPAPATPSVASQPPAGEYDFGEVLHALRRSTNPLAEELQVEFRQFSEQLDEAVVLMQKGRTREAIDLSSRAVDGVLQSRDAVINPLWEAQFFLNAQLATARARLAGTLDHQDPTSNAGKADAQSARMLDNLAARIAATRDPSRRRQLQSQYEAIRTLERMRQASQAITPDQRRMLLGVVRTLEQSSAAHQQVLMGCESLYAQLDSTSKQLHDCLNMLQAMDGVETMMGANGQVGMAGFVDGMRTLQDQMGHFAQSMQGAMGDSITDLDGQVQELQAIAGGDDAGIDDELQSRIDRTGGHR